MKLKKIFLVIILGALMLSSLIGALILIKENQETRRRAAEEETTIPTPTIDQSEDLTGDESSSPSFELDCNFTCTDVYAVDDDGNKIDDSQLQNLDPQEICFEVEGWSDCEQGINKARFQVIGQDGWALGDFNRQEEIPESNARYYYYRWCHDFSQVAETSCHDIDAQVCIGEVCR